MPYSPRLVMIEAKHPAEVVDYALDFAAWLVGEETLATLSSCTATTGLTVAGSPTAPAISGDTVVFWLSGGTTGATYYVTVVVVTSGGRTLVADAEIAVTDPTP